jgi:carbohydrate-selective porin OprB
MKININTADDFHQSLKAAVGNMLTGYKIVGLRNGKAFSLATQEPYDLKLGKIWKSRHGIYLGNTVKFVTMYYQSAETDDDFVDVLLQFEVDPQHIIGTHPSGREAEFKASQAKLTKITRLKPL